MKEELKLIKNIAEFNSAMMDKGLKKMKQGYFGWDDPANEHLLVDGLVKHFTKSMSPENLIDIALYCMFLWNLRKGVDSEY